MKNKIYHMRKKLGLTQKEVAILCGVSINTAAKWEDVSTPNPDNLRKLARIFRCEEKDLI